MGRKKKKHVYLYNPVVQKKIEDLRNMFPDQTYDEIFEKYLTVPLTDDVIRTKFDEVTKLLVKRYKNEQLMELMSAFYMYIIKVGKDEYDLKKLLYNLEEDFRKNIYRKRKE